jgi:phosphotransferase system HPr (HPr) family protein
VIRVKIEIPVILTQDFHHDQLIQLVEETNRFNSYILIKYKNFDINAKSLLSIWMLKISKGENITVYAEGHDAEIAIEHITTLLGLEKV